MTTMATTITQLVTRTTTVTSASASSTNRAAPQGGILEGSNPSEYDSKNPIILFIIQAGIIIIFCRLLHFPLSKIRQPRVIAEVIGGILLGPSVMGRIPGFTDAIFPSSATPNLSLVANIGLVLFLFLVGLEVDLRFLLCSWRTAVSVSIAGMILPFGLGCGVAYGLYHEFRDDSGLKPIGFGVYMLFIGVAMAITAFPVLCRILTELKLLSTPVGVIVLSAGVGNDVVGWILLALCVALVNAGTGLTALWILLVAVGYVLFVVFAVRPGFIWVLKKTGSLQNGPTQTVMALTVLLVLASAFFTGVIGIHPIFGAFIIGLICPHEGGFAIKVTEKIEDLVSTLFLPLYFALSGLSTNLGLLNNSITWGYVIAVIVVAFTAKVIGGTLASRLNGLVWRESLTIGVLMSCKGLVELIVLNIGLQAKILSTRTFTIFVVMALVTTFLTTPLTTILYPEWYQRKLEAWKRGEIDWDGTPLITDETLSETNLTKSQNKVQRILVYLRLDGLPALITFASLLGTGNSPTPAPKVHPKNESTSAEAETDIAHKERPLQMHGVRLVELTERDSTVMKVHEIDDYSTRDPVVNSFRTFGQLANIAISGEAIILPERSFAESIIGRASDHSSDLILLPWSENGSVTEHEILIPETTDTKFSNGPYTHFVMDILRSAKSNAAIFVSKRCGGSAPEQPRSLHRTVSGVSGRRGQDLPTIPLPNRSHIFLPFVGGYDDRLALRFVLQLAHNPQVTVTILPIDLTGTSSSKPEIQDMANHSQSKSLTSTVAPISKEHDTTFLATIRDSLPTDLSSRVVFLATQQVQSGPEALDLIVEHADEEFSTSTIIPNAGHLVVMGRRPSGILDSIMEDLGSPRSDTGKALGPLGSAFIKHDVKASLLVMQALGNTEDGN